MTLLTLHNRPGSEHTSVDGQALPLHLGPVQTVVDVDEKLLSLAEQKARRDGKSLGALVEEALRAVLLVPPPPSTTAGDEVEMVDGDDAFFAALHEIRALGRVPAPHRQVALP